MVITYHGGECFKVSFGDTTLAFNPASKQSKSFTPVKFGADAVFVSMRHPDFNGADQMAYGAKRPFVAEGPGEYEIGMVTARGYGIRTRYDGEDRYNTIYQVRLEDINLVFLGALGNPESDPKIIGELGDIDVLFIPIGGGDVLEASAASKLAVKLEARLVIPMHYDAVALRTFLKEEGNEILKPLDKLTIKKKDLAEFEGEIAVLKV
jgi:L-ascorbate metabolism protein UlaG (beta-lactamase superfamily)